MTNILLHTIKQSFRVNSSNGAETQLKMTFDRAGRPSDATTDEICQAVEDFVMADRRVKVSTIAYEMCISKGCVINILHDKLGMSKVSS